MNKAERVWASSFTTIAVALFTLLGISGVAYASGGAMFTPGSLSSFTGVPLGNVTSHSQIQKCGDCHATPWGTETMTDRCLSCHEDITAQLNDSASLHSLISFGQTELDCRTCHTEHHGPTATLTRIPPGWDPHDQLGFSLKAHRLRMDGTPFECKDCHEKGYSAPFDQLTCATCHLNVDRVFTQEHILAFWTDCQACHDGVDLHGKSFDHNQVPFSLVGVHTITACSKCHVNARNLTDLQSAPQDCFACHEKDDAHTGQFGDKCGICHTAEGWQKSAQFDHDLAGFKLTGLHINATCESCHQNNIYKGIPTDCFSCHQKDDKHLGKYGNECATCHTPDGWNRAVDHTQFAFQLEGKHANVTCEKCHQNAVFKGTPTDCASCHTKDDTHAGQLGKQCGDCHTPNNWTSASFDHNSVSFTLKAHQTKINGAVFVCKDCHIKNYARPFDQSACANCHLQINAPFATEHILTFWTNCMACHDGMDSHGSSFNHNLVPFKLSGKHALAKCSNCHINDRTIADMKATSQDCYACHQKDDFHAGTLGTNCTTCHTPEAWKPAKVDHSKFAFPLNGKHSSTTCSSCHINGVFKGTPKDCYSCHAKNDVHAGTLGTQCDACHTPADWKSAAFDHNTVSFALTSHKTKTDGTVFVCKDCHVNGYAAPFDQNSCGNCHLQINQTFATDHFLTFGTGCIDCHDGVEALGSAFNHDLVQFNLAGKHEQVSCSKCHINARKLADLKAAPQNCFACHAKDDKHNGGLGTNCVSCHVANGWNLAKVDHSQFAFPLQGKHTTTACNSCHINGIFKGTPKDCASCHTKNDVHAGRFGTQCGTCHTPTGWSPASFDHSTVPFVLSAHKTKTDGTPFACKDCHVNGYAAPFNQLTCANCHLQVNYSFAQEHILTFWTDCTACHDGVESHGSSFDHNLVPFHLAAKHGQVRCAQCHVNARNLNDLKAAPQDCFACHAKNDWHNGQFGTNCATCHNPEGWEQARVDHSTFAFHLDGKHVAVTCENCHQNGVFKGTPMDCASCHLKNDPHAGVLGTQCDSCHTANGWAPSIFDHNRSAFLLTGKHSSVSCSQCHTNKLFKGTPSDCASCHAKSEPHAGKLGTDCASCHTTNGWVPSTFDHNRSNFLLTGKHSTVACGQCHTDKTFKGTPSDCASCHTKNDPHSGALGNQCAACHNTSVWKPSTFNHVNSIFPLTGKHINATCSKCHTDLKFKGTPTLCYSCHAQNDRHGGKYGTNCSACHSTTAWKPATFNHNLSAFPLTGKHVNTTCTKCHINNVFAGTPKDCYSCHAKNDHHGGKYGTSCATCHTTTAWEPATFSHTFPLDHGENGTVACTTCHPSNTNSYTCYGCHEHTASNIASEHKNISNYQNCVQCHANGGGGEDGGDDDD